MFFIYRWTNKRNRKMYIGSHEGDPNDGYIGSGKHFKKAYAMEPEMFEREILSEWPSREEMLHEEKRLLIELGCASNPFYYNLVNESSGGYLHGHLSEDRRREMYSKWTQSSLDSLASMTEEEKERLADKKRASWKTSSKLEDHRRRTSERMKKLYSSMSNEERSILSDRCKMAYWSRSPEEIEQHRQNHSLASKRSYELNPQLRNVRSAAFKRINRGRVYVNLCGVTKRLPREEAEQLIDKGWQWGMGPRKKSSSSAQT